MSLGLAPLDLYFQEAKKRGWLCFTLSYSISSGEKRSVSKTKILVPKEMVQLYTCYIESVEDKKGYLQASKFLQANYYYCPGLQNPEHSLRICLCYSLHGTDR